MCSISAFGQTGPLATNLASIIWARRMPESFRCAERRTARRTIPMIALGDVSTGAHAMGAICAALLGRARTGRGQHLDISLLDTYFHYHEAGVETHTSLSKGEIKPDAIGDAFVVRGPGRDFQGARPLLYHHLVARPSIRESMPGDGPARVGGGPRFKTTPSA